MHSATRRSIAPALDAVWLDRCRFPLDRRGANRISRNAGSLVRRHPEGIRARSGSTSMAASGLSISPSSSQDLCWRTSHKPPDLPPDIGEFERRTSLAAHHLLYALMVLIPIFGIVTYVWHGRVFDYGFAQLNFGVASNRGVFRSRAGGPPGAGLLPVWTGGPARRSRALSSLRPSRQRASAHAPRRGGVGAAPGASFAPLLRQLDIELVAPLAEREPRLRGVEPHDHAVAVLEPDFAVRLGGDGETPRALNPRAGELGDVGELCRLRPRPASSRWRRGR